jgi:predicted CoA-binding protein
MDTEDLVEQFLGFRRLALVGVSRNPGDFSRRLLRDFGKRGYQVVPVNPAMDEVEGQRCYPSVKAIMPKVEVALLMTPSVASAGVVDECAAAGVQLIWLHQGGGTGAYSLAAVAACNVAGIPVISGVCPYMYLKDAGFLHRVHRFFRRRNARPAG